MQHFILDLEFSKIIFLDFIEAANNRRLLHFYQTINYCLNKIVINELKNYQVLSLTNCIAL